VIDQAALAEAFGQLDAGTRALLDLSLRRAIPDDQVAKVLGVDPTSIPPRRARGIAQLADIMEVPGPSELAALLIAIPDLPEEAWGVPTPAVAFGGSVSLAGRAKAFRRVAVAASPLVALGAVLAAVVVASSDHSGPSSPAGGANAASIGGAAPVPATAPEPESRHGLPPGVSLAHIRRTTPAHHRRGAHHRRAKRHHHPGAPEPAILAREPAPITHTTPVAFNPTPVAPQQPRHETHHNTPVKHKPSPKQVPAPDKSPSAPTTPTPDPVPTENNTVAVPVSTPEQPKSNETPAPSKPPKQTPTEVNLSPPEHNYGSRSGSGYGGGSHGGGGYCDHGESSHHGSSHHGYSQGQSHSGRSFSPPGLFRKHHGGGGRH
jgi:hypothetical protein